MPLDMSRATLADISGIGAILAETTVESQWGKLQFGSIRSKDWCAYLEDGLREAIQGSDPPSTIMKVSDTATSEIVSFIHLVDPVHAGAEKTRSVNQAPVAKKSKPAGFNVAPIRAYCALMMAVRERATKNLTYFHIADLATKGSHRRQGAASMLLNWAIEHADSENQAIYLEATPDGCPLYRKMGFEEVEKFALDLKPYGEDRVYEEVAMLLRSTE